MQQQEIEFLINGDTFEVPAWEWTNKQKPFVDGMRTNVYLANLATEEDIDDVWDYSVQFIFDNRWIVHITFDGVHEWGKGIVASTCDTMIYSDKFTDDEFDGKTCYYSGFSPQQLLSLLRTIALMPEYSPTRKVGIKI